MQTHPRNELSASESHNFFTTNRELIVVSVLSLLVLGIYAQATGFDFISLDDNLYVYENPAVLSGLHWQSIKWAFTVFYSANWHPLTWLSHMLDVQIHGINPGGYHATNIFLHLINSCLAFAVFKRMTGRFLESAVVAALFAVHPMHVESVAWIAERKDLLSTLFWLLTMAAYLRYAGKAHQTGEQRVTALTLRSLNPSYLLVILLFALGLMSKPMLVTLPFVLLLVDYWPLERLQRLKDFRALLIEKIPLFALSAASCYVTIIAQRTANAVESLEELPLGLRLLNAVIAYAKYVVSLFYPSPLAIWYPYERSFAVWEVVSAAVLLLAISVLCLWQFKRRKYLLVGWLWFLGTLVPVIGIIQVGGQSMADRYTYVPFFGLFVMLVWAAADLFSKFNLRRSAFVALFGSVSLIFAFLSFKQTKLWHNSETMYRHTLAVTENNYLIAHNLCHYLMKADRLDEADPLCRSSIAINPRFWNGYNTLGIVQIKRGETAQAEESFLKAIQLAPYNSFAYLNLAVAQVILERPEDAEVSVQKAATLTGNSMQLVGALNDIAVAYNTKGNYEKAAENLMRVLTLVPNDIPARGNLALTLSKLERFDEAHKLIGEALRAAPNDPSAYNTYGLILLEQNRNAEAAAQFEKALQLRPDHEDARQNLQKAKGGE